MALLLSLAPSAPAQDQAPRFQARVDVTSLDVTVLGGDGRPILDLTAADFQVSIDGRVRRVVDADWVALAAPAGGTPAAPPLTEGFSTNVNAASGRIVLIAIDQQNIRYGGMIAIREQVIAFVDRLAPSDRVGLVTIGPGGQAVPFTADHGRVTGAIGKLLGQKALVRAGEHQVALWEALAINREDQETFRWVVLRECGLDLDASGAGRSGAPTGCPQEVRAQSESMARSVVADGERTLAALRAIFEGLGRIDVPKTLVLVTEGFVLDDQRPSFVELERLAAASRTSLYALRLDQRVSDLTQRSALSPGSGGRDRMMVREGLDRLALATRGRVFDVVNTPDAALQSLEYELAGYYVVGVESDPTDTTDRTRDIDVSVNRPGASVRTRRTLRPNSAPRARAELLAAALASPLPATALPIRVASFPFGGIEPEKVQLVIHAAIGEAYSTDASLTVGYLLLAADGAVVASRGTEALLGPLTRGLPSPLQYNAAVSVDPGEYVLRVAATDGDRVGSVEHPVRAALTDAGMIRLSALVAGGPVYPADSLRPTMTADVRFGNLHAFMEGYGTGAPETTVRYEVVKRENGPVLIEADALVRPVGDGRAIFTRTMSARRLPPGTYTLRAIVSRQSVAERRFVIPQPEGQGIPAEVFLPVPEERLTALGIPADLSALEPGLADAWRRLDGLLRNRQFGAARDLLEQADARWPDAARFAKPLAFVHAMFGRAAEAMRHLQRHLAAYPTDVDALALAVEWAYTLRLAGGDASAGPDALRLARTYAADYERLNGPELGLVQLWLDYLSPPPAP